jgi:hypothetical protein
VKRDRIAVALLIAIIAFIFADVLFLGRGFYFRDLTRYYYPSKKLVRDIILGGELPSWNPYWASGQPLAANPDYGVFYPLQWLTLLPDYDFWFRFQVVLHYWIAAAGAYVLLRRFALRQESAVFGALLFSLGGVLVSSTSLLPILYAAVWLPWVIWAADRMLERFTWRRFAVAALFLALPMLAAEPITVAQICLLTAAYAYVRSGTVRVLPRIIAMGLAAAAVGAVQLIPVLDLFGDSARSRGFPFALVSIWSTPPLRLLELFVPELMGPGSEHFRFFWGTAQYRWLDPFYPGIYFGVIAAALAVAALTLRLARWRAVVVALIVGWILALGSHTPLLRILYESGLFSSFRYPEKFLYLALSPLVFFTAVAFDRVLDGDVRLARRALIVSLIVAGSCGVLWLLALLPGYTAAFIAFWDISIHPLAQAMAARSSSVWLAGLLRALVAAGVLWLAVRGRSSWALLAIAVLVVDLGGQRTSIAETLEGEFFREPPAVVQQIDRSERLFHQADWYTATRVARSYFDLPEMYWVIRNGLYPMVGATWGIATTMNADADQTFLLPSVEFTQAMFELRGRGVERWYEPLMAMSAASYRAMYLPFEQQLAQAQNDRTQIQPIVFVPTQRNPRFYFADRVLQAPTRAEFVRQIASGMATPRVAFTAASPFIPAVGRVLKVAEGTNWAEIEVESGGDALLVCSITRHKYWNATIDERPAAIVPVNIAYQAVRVPAGRHKVSLCYWNPLLAVGGGVSVVSAAILIALIIASRDRAEL